MVKENNEKVQELEKNTTLLNFKFETMTNILHELKEEMKVWFSEIKNEIKTLDWKFAIKEEHKANQEKIKRIETWFLWVIWIVGTAIITAILKVIWLLWTK